MKDPQDTPVPGERPELPAPDYAARIAPEVRLSRTAVAAIIALFDEGATVPFIARYRKEATGGAEDLAIQETRDRLTFHRELHARKNTILQSIAEQGSLTPELFAAIGAVTTRTELEDLYLPYRPKRRTRATIAKEKGLEPLAERMLAQEDRAGSPSEVAVAFIDPDRGVADAEDALQGARDIVAERIVETAEWRAPIRDLTWRRGLFTAQAARGKGDVRSKFTDYYAYQELIARVPSHRVLALLRGEEEGFLTLRLQPDLDEARALLGDQVVRDRKSIWTEEVARAAADACERLLLPQIATEIRADLKERADLEAVRVFASNLRELLMAPPLGGRPVLAIDPGFRTGCKVVVLDATGRLLDHGVVYPTAPREDVAGTNEALDRWFARFPDLAAIAIGNGTGGRETFSVVRSYLAKRQDVLLVQVNESGASIYSASAIARDELPDHDVTVRGAVSIGRRLQDPLAELVKIDPKAIGVGQYQHDVDQKLLKQRLDEVVESCVNQVGVDLNTASPSLLRYVSGLNAKLARAIVARRDEQGPFRSRAELTGVPGLGKKTFELAAGFLRVRGGHPLDDSAVHPERYALVERIARDLGRELRAIIGDRAVVRAIDLNRYVDDTVGLFTLEDIQHELELPGRDPRRDFDAVDFRDDVRELEDLQAGMILDGVVTNVTGFGAFVDVGVHQDGLVHVSQIARRFVRDPADELRVGQKVRVKVLEIDLERRRIALSIKEAMDENAS